MDFSVVRAEPAHAETIARFNQAMALETEDKHLEDDVILNGVRRMLDDEQLGFYLVARSGEQPGDEDLVGCLGVTYEWSDWRNGLFWWIQSVYVAPGWRSRGVFSAMYRAVREQALAAGNTCGIRLYVEKDNRRAYRTYVNLGMQETEYRIMEEEFEGP